MEIHVDEALLYNLAQHQLARRGILAPEEGQFIQGGTLGPVPVGR